MGNFDRGNRDGGRSFGGGRSSFSGGGRDRRGGFGSDRGDRRGGDRGSFGGGSREMHQAICDNCKKECEVPFRPTSNKPVYCSSCFEKMGNDRGSSTPQRSTFQSSAPEQGKNQLDVVNNKLEALSVKVERILKLLEPQAVPAVSHAPIKEAIKVAKAVKSEKSVEPAKKEIKKATPAKKK